MQKAVLILGLLLVMSARSWALSQMIAWDYAQGTDPATGFNVYRGPTCAGTMSKLNSAVLPLTPTQYTDTTVQAGQTYCWQVKAVNASGKESEPSNSLTFQVPGVLNAPTNLRPGGTTVP